MALPDTSTLIVDLGGTNVRFALADTRAATPLLADSIRHYPSSRFGSLAEAGRRYLDDIGAQPRLAYCAVAGRVEGEEAYITNLPWQLSANGIARELGLDAVYLLNDFEAMSLSVPLLHETDMRAIGGPKPPRLGSAPVQTFAIVGPGTGLGVGGLVLRNGQLAVLRTEGGHVSFAPQDDLEIEILRRLLPRHGRVSNERLLCGSGLLRLYQTLAGIHAVAAPHESPEAITNAALAGEAQCIETIDRFLAMLGSAAGDLVLAMGAWQGVYLAGGLLSALRPWLDHGAFRQRFTDKGRMSDSLERAPTVAITHPNPGLLGAAAAAVLGSGGNLLATH
ncbi:MAG TPA: glucokinase [Rhodanobacteraceae bacterium]|nr:glucokinase [Rhodanobacteraceae bacterium]